MPDAAVLIRIALRALDLATAEGNGDARHAARLLRGAALLRGGRPKVDDTALLAEIERLGGGCAAIASVSGGNPSVARRLRRKRGQNQFLSTQGVSICPEC